MNLLRPVTQFAWREESRWRRVQRRSDATDVLSVRSVLMYTICSDLCQSFPGSLAFSRAFSRAFSLLLCLVLTLALWSFSFALGIYGERFTWKNLTTEEASRPRKKFDLFRWFHRSAFILVNKQSAAKNRLHTTIFLGSLARQSNELSPFGLFDLQSVSWPVRQGNGSWLSLSETGKLSFSLVERSSSGRHGSLFAATSQFVAFFPRLSMSDTFCVTLNAILTLHTFCQWTSAIDFQWIFVLLKKMDFPTGSVSFGKSRLERRSAKEWQLLLLKILSENKEF